jgi:hypothetical protein
MAAYGRDDKEDPVLEGEVYPGFKSFLTNMWTWLDTINYILFIVFILVRISLISMILHPSNAVKGTVVF